MSLSNTEIMLGDFLSPFNQPCLVAEEGLGLLDDYLEVAKNFGSHGFSSNKAKVGSSDWLAVASLNDATDNSQEDAFSGMDWMVEKMDLKEFDFDALLGIDDLEATVSPDEFMATLEDTCEPFDPSIQEIPSKETPLTTEPVIQLPVSPPGADQVAPLTPVLPFPLSPESLISTADHSFCLELGSEVDVLEGDKKPEAHILVVVIPKCEKEEEINSDNDSGIGMSPSYLGTPQQSPTTSISSLSDSQSVTAPPDISVRLKPYDLPIEKIVSAKVKGEKRVDKKLKKMEQNKTAATSYRQKKRAEREAHILVVVIPKCEKEEEINSDNDSGIGTSPSYLGTPQQSPTTSISSLSDSQSVTAPPDISVRLKPYDLPIEKIVSAKVKGEKRVDKKLKKMEQNKTAATRYRQKKRAEREAVSGECRELEQKNEALREKADSLSKEIQYLKDLIEEVRKAKNKKVKVPE
ncbi:cyclic AMP-dependent transcription factor ATF-4 [Paroedura picta]|uniref:cyclic AMP-dependent transcription factor ATF-4 n=1 Tax=Paroedura picta TaxID=143630 RepID=UPI004055E52B